jgi:(2Fe-2S) ferredoxin
VYWNEKHVLVCTAVHCMKKGSSTLAGRLRVELKRHGLDERVLCNTCDSIEICDMGPNVVVYPDGIIYSGVQVSDIKEIINHVEGGPPVERLRLTPDRPDEVKRRRFFAAAVGESVPVTLERFRQLAAEHGLDDAWVEEQRQRGFIAVKAAESGQDVTVTSKARVRYGLPSSKPSA